MFDVTQRSHQRMPPKLLSAYSVVLLQAGMVTKLSSRCTVMAATNPKKPTGRDHYHTSVGEPEEVSTNLESPLLSRLQQINVDSIVQNFILYLGPWRVKLTKAF